MVLHIPFWYVSRTVSFWGISIVQCKSCNLVIDIYFICPGKLCSTFTSMYFDCTVVNRNIFLFENSAVVHLHLLSLYMIIKLGMSTYLFFVHICATSTFRYCISHYCWVWLMDIERTFVILILWTKRLHQPFDSILCSSQE